MIINCKKSLEAFDPQMKAIFTLFWKFVFTNKFFIEVKWTDNIQIKVRKEIADQKKSIERTLFDIFPATNSKTNLFSI